LKQLFRIYINNGGKSANLLLNVGAGRRGIIPKPIVNALLWLEKHENGRDEKI
jgi:alpha-L-fucosidase